MLPSFELHLLSKSGLFKKHVRGIVCRPLQDSIDACLFRPSPPMMDALIGVGITGKHATLNLNIALNQQEQDTIAQWLTKIIRTISNKFTKEYILGGRNLVPNQLKLNGKVSWDCTIPILTHEMSIKKGWEGPPTDHDEHPLQPDTAFFECPQCRMVEPSSCKALQHNNLDSKHKCSHCNKHSAVKLWKCKCGTRWHMCLVHRYSTHSKPRMSHTDKGQPLPASSSGPLAKRKAPLIIYDEVLADDLKIAQNKLDQQGLNHIVFDMPFGMTMHHNVRPSFLGPILKKRFMGGTE